MGGCVLMGCESGVRGFVVVCVQRLDRTSEEGGVEGGDDVWGWAW